MKKITLTSIESPVINTIYTRQKLYHITLGNGLSEYFTSNKQACKYLVHINTELNLILHEVNNFYCECFSLYRHNWFYFATQGVNQKKFMDYESVIKNSLADIEKSFSLIIERCQWANGNVFVFTHFFGILSHLNRVLLILIKLHRAKSNYASVRNIEGLRRRGLYIKKTLKELK